MSTLARSRLSQECMPIKKLLFLLVAAALASLPRLASAQMDFGGWGDVTYLPQSGYTTFTHTPRAPHARRDTRIDPHLLTAARIADSRAYPHSTARCWQYVKDALLAAGVVRDRPSTNYAFEAGSELTSRYGFVRLPIHDPYSAPVGSVLVYQGGDAGHVEFRTDHGFASDYHSPWRCRYRLIGVYAKLSA
jgi:hypothetical protein